MGRVDVALAEYTTLRAEILARAQSQTTVVNVALTTTAVIGGVAFGTGAAATPRLEILLALPFVLTGLGLTYLAHSLSCLLIGDYIGTRLWPALAAAQPGDESKERPVVIHSWERHIGSARATGPIRNARGWLSFVPGVFVFGVPSLAALAINYELAWAPLVTDTAASGLRWAWFAGSVTVVAGAGLFGWAQRYERREPEPTAERQDAGDVEAVLHIEAQIDGRPPTHGTAVLTPAAGRDDAYPS